jgi:transcriptional regulator with XRE-family HTH domain
MTTVLSRFGRRCRDLRSAKNLTMGDQAKHMRCPVHEISSIECGQRTPSDDYLKSFRELVGLDEDEYRDLKKKIRSNVIELNRVKALGNNSRSMRLFRKISQMNPDEIRDFKKPPEYEVRND